MSELLYSSHFSTSSSQCCNGSPTVPGSYWFLWGGAPMALLMAAFLGRTVIYCAASCAALDLLHSDRAFGATLSLHLTRFLEIELVLLKWSVLTPNCILSLKLNPGRCKVSENMFKSLVNDDTEIEALPAVFTRPLTLVWPPKSFMLSSSLPPCFPRLFTAGCFLTHNLNTSRANTLFMFWLNYQNGHLTLDSTVDLDLFTVYVSF